MLIIFSPSNLDHCYLGQCFDFILDGRLISHNSESENTHIQKYIHLTIKHLLSVCVWTCIETGDMRWNDKSDSQVWHDDINANVTQKMLSYEILSLIVSTTEVRSRGVIAWTDQWQSWTLYPNWYNSTQSSSIKVFSHCILG